jgi:hypothetical protein
MSAATVTVSSSRSSVDVLAIRSRESWGSTFLLMLLLAVLFAVLQWGPNALAAGDDAVQPKPPPAVTGTCRDCGVVRSIREIRTERKGSQSDTYVASSQYLQSRSFDQQPLIGPAISFSWGANNPTQPRIGAVGSPEMQQRFIELSYEVIVRFDDGRFGLIEQDSADDLRPGDRVKVAKGRVERTK